MTLPSTADPPFDPGWLDTLAGACRSLSASTPRLQDVYLERRLELRMSTLAGACHAEESRSDGAAARWRYPSRTAFHARTGTSQPALEDLLSRHGRRTDLPRLRPAAPAELEPPAGWRDWALRTLSSARRGHCTVRFLARRAVVVGPERWAAVACPPLVRVEVDGESPSALLAVWQHPDLESWLSELVAPPPARRWRPEPGLKVPVLLRSGTAGVLLHELIGHLVESDLVSCGDSPLAALAGAAVTALALDVADDPLRRDLPGAFSCDDEGVAAAAVQLVRAGRLVGWLCDRAGARRLRAADGRGRRASWARPPVPRLSNLIVAPGTTDPDDIQRELRDGLLVTRLGGATVDPLSGRLVLRVERGWELRQGRRRRPLEPFELTGGALDVLAHVEPAVGNDPCPDWRLGWCVKDGVPLPTGSEAPTLLVHHLEVL
ncbi:MAG TPA: metallopeptidase TldD-related protein [Thermoanaerobaculales bacterium]|nr:metallopeptidase TldD-related protein [Thermoanaerobaculales bacterium]HPA81518.1 metallopeptidase TldD-related protein [Thermoanaerobaculales bacterium]HQL28707.1 metallopeptidase TldD-related protein [Thermoanaerobaculales bacterium]HQN95659.1 metallopeptidase TldD-related protein [Thermoanaerobaculales bacterium]HQP45061.1 metallopeptidase TldD-related protein [Thermoanaerobaculales bacterium]